MSARLEERFTDLALSLDYSNALELLVATILSAQCTDARVNEVTPALFARFPTAEEYAGADREELEEYVRPTGFYRNKAKHIQEMADRLVSDHGGEVPDEMKELIQLAGVARKTANVVLSNWFGKHEGVVVDTHVKRVARRLGLTEETNPEKIERDLMALLPREGWRPFAWRLILHGRSTCHARKPTCVECVVADLCPSAHSFD
ncbi:MAG: endonuclease III [Gemmatimonadetes bacterium]|nr:endonuclease III [Gemmatimonadota bacterium]MCZ6824326.1 endonuclease III [Gemmatimonadota bacterium]